jgi:DNA anti-recombination protein RmuC
MMADHGESIELLRGIWNEMKGLNGWVRRTNTRLDGLRADLAGRLDQTNARLDQTNARLDQTNTRLDGVREELGARIAETNARLDRMAARVDAGFALVNQRFDQLLVGEHGREHRDFRERIARLETTTGLPPK